jgi:hypothetical protein
MVKPLKKEVNISERLAMGCGATFSSYERGGEGGIRTHGELTPSTVFKTIAIDHSATSPGEDQYSK